MRKIGTALLCAMAISGCAQTSQDFSATQTAPLLTNENVTRSTEATESALGALLTRASLFEEPKTGSKDWDKVIMAGMDFVDESCGEYLTAVYLAAREDARRPSFGASIRQAFTGGGVTKAAFSGPETSENATAQAGQAAADVEEQSRRKLSLQAAIFHAANEDTRADYRRRLFSPAQTIKRREKFGALAALRGYVALCAPARVDAQLHQAAAPTR